MKATKSSKKKFDSDFEISRSSSRRVKSSMKKSSVSWFAVLLVLIIGFAGGFFANKLIYKNDTYAMNGNDTIYIGSTETSQTYTELGVKCIAFGKDYSSDCTVTYYYRADLTEDKVKVSAVDETTAGIYYAVYTTPASKYSSVTLIRNIIVLGEEM